MKKEVERLQEQYKEILGEHKIWYEIERVDPLDRRSPKCYKIVSRLANGNLICESGQCKDKESIIKMFESQLQQNKKVFEKEV